MTEFNTTAYWRLNSHNQKRKGQVDLVATKTPKEQIKHTLPDTQKSVFKMHKGMRLFDGSQTTFTPFEQSLKEQAEMEHSVSLPRLKRRQIGLFEGVDKDLSRRVEQIAKTQQKFSKSKFASKVESHQTEAEDAAGSSSQAMSHHMSLPNLKQSFTIPFLQNLEQSSSKQTEDSQSLSQKAKAHPFPTTSRTKERIDKRMAQKFKFIDPIQKIKTERDGIPAGGSTQKTIHLLQKSKHEFTVVENDSKMLKKGTKKAALNPGALYQGRQSLQQPFYSKYGHSMSRRVLQGTEELIKVKEKLNWKVEGLEPNSVVEDRRKVLDTHQRRQSQGPSNLVTLTESNALYSSDPMCQPQVQTARVTPQQHSQLFQQHQAQVTEGSFCAQPILQGQREEIERVVNRKQQWTLKSNAIQKTSKKALSKTTLPQSQCVQLDEIINEKVKQIVKPMLVNHSGSKEKGGGIFTADLNKTPKESAHNSPKVAKPKIREASCINTKKAPFKGEKPKRILEQSGLKPQSGSLSPLCAPTESSQSIDIRPSQRSELPPEYSIFGQVGTIESPSQFEKQLDQMLREQRLEVDLKIVEKLRLLLLHTDEDEDMFETWREDPLFFKELGQEKEAKLSDMNSFTASPGVGGQTTFRTNNLSLQPQASTFVNRDRDWLPVEAVDAAIASGEEQIGRKEEPMVELMKRRDKQKVEVNNDNLGKLIEEHQSLVRLKEEVRASNHLDPFSVRLFTPHEQEKRGGRGEDRALDDYLDETYYQKVDQLRELLEKRVKKPSKVLRQISKIDSVITNMDKQSKLRAKFEALQEFVDRIKSFQKFFGKAKLGTAPLLESAGKADLDTEFIRQCNAQRVLVMQVFQKIHNNSLEFLDCKVNHGFCEAVKNLLVLEKNLITRIVVSNNGLNDEALSILFQGLVHQVVLKSLIIKNNAFGLQSLEAIRSVFTRRMPNHVSEIRLINCKILVDDTVRLLECLRDSQIRRLSLVNANITAESFPKLLALLQESKTLCDLDISWNKINQKMFVQFFEVLRHNRRIETLNISWNMLQDSSQLKADALSEVEQQMVLDFGVFIKHNQQLLRLDISHCKANQCLLTAIMQMLRRAPTLLTINVSGNEGITRSFKRAINRHLKVNTTKVDSKMYYQAQATAKAIMKQVEANQAQHVAYLESITIKRVQQLVRQGNHQLSKPFNEVNNQLVYQRILGHVNDLPGARHWTELSAQTRPPELMEDFIADKCNYTLVFWSKKMANLPKVQKQSKERDMRALEQCIRSPSLEEIEHEYTFKTHMIPKIPTVVDGKPVFQEEPFKSPPLLAGSFNNWKYAAMYKVEDLAMLLDREFVDPLVRLKRAGFIREEVTCLEEMDMEELVYYIKHRTDLLKLYRENWLSIMHTCCLNYKNPSLVHLEHFKNFFVMKQIKKVSRDLFENSLMQAQKEDFIENQLLNGLKLSSKKGRINDKIPEITKAYKDYSNMVEADSNQIWVGVAMSKPGKHTFVVKYDDENFSDVDSFCTDNSLSFQGSEKAESKDSGEATSQSLTFHHCIIAPRDQEVPKILKRPYCKQDLSSRFKKNGTVFNDWQEDTDFILKSAFQCDMEVIKLYYFIRGEDLKMCERSVLFNFSDLKKIFTILAAKSNYPVVSWTAFVDYCRECDILDETVTTERLFEAFELVNEENQKINNPMVNNPEDELQRYEFIELLFRVAGMKYIETKVCDSYNRAFNLLLNDHIFKHPMKDMWQEFRDKYLWKQDVCDMLYRNRSYIEKIFKDYIREDKPVAGMLPNRSQLGSTSPRKRVQTKGYMSYEEAMNFITRDSGLNISLEKARYCYGMSKTTVMNENQKFDIVDYTSGEVTIAQTKNQYHEMRYPEFLEMLGRIAEIFYMQNFNEDGTPVMGSENYAFVNYFEIVLEQFVERFLGRKIIAGQTSESDNESQSDPEY